MLNRFLLEILQAIMLIGFLAKERPVPAVNYGKKLHHCIAVNAISIWIAVDC